ncbi:phosphate acyltransferase PlsX [Pelodictyon phaeoclathratiforme]|jgi:glycerol-3-phosphate acyltransferase PlsX|uniref:Phosphate acyltransferase n=1 Tax=Pelodictyon phaeoclathratiforme (strain DSM 5477 / BU-1) TaxID=324925 RepID=B4SBB6_PELPB|nr:phosphate acyltransferase PlsX [Pelodictyon phaeoclathratiforme]ACF42537.1 fatty acid/phospholipid synthesis protein PlsX [Pelodictyon phaeoclathratiforme BU-1]MBV5290236.1 phosphate acyltransferase PlsX [Pelodictyon phaeoclathratiforme]
MLTIVVDAMGGDHAPACVIEGTVQALQESGNRFNILLIGQSEKVEPLLASYDTSALNLTFLHAPEVVTMEDIPATAVKTKQESSLVKGLQLCKAKQADAFVSAGNTGAQMAASLFVLGRLPGVLRPTIYAYFPRLSEGLTNIVDIGANVDCKPEHLVQFAQMLTIYQRYGAGIEQPLTGLLNIGEEEGKGSEMLKQAYWLLKEADRAGKINFLGNIEGHDILKGKASIVVCDGVVGNTILKFGESIPEFMGILFKRSLEKVMISGQMDEKMAAMTTSLFKGLFDPFDVEIFGGVPFLGVDGISIVGHGRSSSRAIKNMIYMAEHMIEKRVNEHIAEVLSEK